MKMQNPIPLDVNINNIEQEMFLYLLLLLLLECLEKGLNQMASLVIRDLAIINQRTGIYPKNIIVPESQIVETSKINATFVFDFSQQNIKLPVEIDKARTTMLY